MSRSFFPQDLAESLGDFTGYEPTFETAQEFRGRFEKVCNAFLNTHIAEQQREAAERGYPEYAGKRKLELHLEWAVLYQVCEMSPDDIAHKYEKADEKEMRKQIRNTLKLIKLEPRKPKRGG